MAQPTADEQYMLELVNLARANPSAIAASFAIDLNQGLASNTLSPLAKQPLAFNFNLIDAARGHSQWMLSTDTFSHTGAGGSNYHQRMSQAGYSFSGNSTSGENISLNRSGGSINVTQAIASQHAGLFKSSGHRSNLLNDRFRDIGIGAVQGTYQGLNALATTQNFARSGNTVFLTGVVFNDGVVNDDFYTVGEGLGGVTVKAVRTDNAQQFSTTTYGSGGYHLALNPGTYQVSFSGGGLGSTFQRYVTVSDRNLKLDLATDLTGARQPLRIQGQPSAFRSAMLAWDTLTSMVSTFRIDSGSRTAIATPIGRTIEDTHWRLQTTGDLTGDGQDDVLLRNFASGQNLLWQMTPFGEAIAAERLIGRVVPDPHWSLSGTGDFNRDGRTDILLRNEAADQIVAWYLNRDGTIHSESLVGRGFGSNNWKIEATADFNGDGQADILLRNAGAGQTLLWTMNGAAIASEALVGRPVSGTAWQLEGAKDFNGNGTIDLFWRHTSTGQGLLWLMQSPTQIGQELLIANVPTGVSQLVL